MKILKAVLLTQLAFVFFLFAGCEQQKDTTIIKKDSTTTVNNNTQTTVVVPQTTEKSTTTTTTVPPPTTTTTTTPSTTTQTQTTVTYPRIGKTWTTVVTKRTDLTKSIEAKKLPEAQVVVVDLRDLLKSLPSQSAELSAEKRSTLDNLVADATELSNRLDKYLAANDFANAKATSTQLNALLDKIKILYPKESF
ncbi:hypothetical protein BH10BAC5_BH10BAC5_23700 [soil metagenome]